MPSLLWKFSIRCPFWAISILVGAALNRENFIWIRVGAISGVTWFLESYVRGEMLPEHSLCERFTPSSPDTCTLCLGSRTFSLTSLLSNTRLHNLTYSYSTQFQLVMTWKLKWLQSCHLGAGRKRKPASSMLSAHVLCHRKGFPGSRGTPQHEAMDMKCEKYDHI